MVMLTVESCFEFLHVNTVRMLVAACALIVAKIIDDEPVFITATAELLKVDAGLLVAAERFVVSVLLQTSHRTGRRVTRTAYACPLLRCYEACASACDTYLRELAATHIACCYRVALAVRMRMARRAERSAAQSATGGEKLAAAALSPCCIMSWPYQATPDVMQPFVLDSKGALRLKGLAPFGSVEKSRYWFTPANY